LSSSCFSHLEIL